MTTHRLLRLLPVLCVVALGLTLACDLDSDSDADPSGRPAPGAHPTDDPRVPDTINVLVRRNADGTTEIVDIGAAHDPVPEPISDSGSESGSESGKAIDPDDVIEVHDKQGNVIYEAPISWASRPLSFSDGRHPSDPNALQGGLHGQGEIRVVSVPLSHKSAHIDASDAAPPVSIAHLGEGQCPPCVEKPILLWPDVERDPRRVLNIVIMGDGFREEDRDWFVNRARFLSFGLLGHPPYSRHTDKIQIHLIPTVSKESGVDEPGNRPGKGKDPDTCLDLTGGTGGCCGTDSPHKLFRAVGCHFPLWSVDLRIVIANVPEYGGRGHGDIRAAYINAYTGAEQSKFLNVALHEIGHALAGLADEYMGCEPVDMQPPFPNVASREQVEAGTVPWLPLARPDELDADGNLGYVYDIPEAEKDSCPDRMVKVPQDLRGKLGLFWGAMFVDGKKTPCTACNVYSDPRGAHYYRPMARCKMRSVMDPFCRACEAALEQAILRYARMPEPPS